MDKPITLCDRCDNWARCCLDYDGNACRRNRTVEPTNADRIRAMSDEELANWLGDMIFPQCLVCPATDEPWCLDRDCFTVMLAWLRARAEGGADDGGD